MAERKTGVQCEMKKLGAPIPVGSRRSLQAVNQELEFFRSQGLAGAIALGPGEGAFLQSFEARNTLPPDATLFIYKALVFADCSHAEFHVDSLRPSRSSTPSDGPNLRVESSREFLWIFVVRAVCRDSPSF